MTQDLFDALIRCRQERDAAILRAAEVELALEWMRATIMLAANNGWDVEQTNAILKAPTVPVVEAVRQLARAVSALALDPEHATLDDVFARLDDLERLIPGISTR